MQKKRSFRQKRSNIHTIKGKKLDKKLPTGKYFGFGGFLLLGPGSRHLYSTETNSLVNTASEILIWCLLEICRSSSVRMNNVYQTKEYIKAIQINAGLSLEIVIRLQHQKHSHSQETEGQQSLGRRLVDTNLFIPHNLQGNVQCYTPPAQGSLGNTCF